MTMSALRTRIGARTFLSANPSRWRTGGQECPRSGAPGAGAASFVWLVLLAGCTVGSDYKRPEAMAMPAAYAGATNGWKVAQPQAQFPKGTWWEIFGDAEQMPRAWW